MTASDHPKELRHARRNRGKMPRSSNSNTAAGGAGKMTADHGRVRVRLVRPVAPQFIRTPAGSRMAILLEHFGDLRIATGCSDVSGSRFCSDT